MFFCPFSCGENPGQLLPCFVFRCFVCSPTKPFLTARLRGRTATQLPRRNLRRFWGGFWGRVLGKGSGEGFLEGGLLWVLQLKRVLRSSEKGVSRRCPERPLGEYDPLGVHPTSKFAFLVVLFLNCQVCLRWQGSKPKARKVHTNRRVQMWFANFRAN